MIMRGVSRLPFQGEELGVLHLTPGVTLSGYFPGLSYVRLSACKPREGTIN